MAPTNNMMKALIVALVGIMAATQTAAQCATPDPAAFFNITAASPIFTCTGGTVPTGPAGGTCFLTAEGCITDGPGNYGSFERCTIEVLRDGFLFLRPGDAFGIEPYFHGFAIGGAFADERSEIEVAVQGGDIISWRTGGGSDRAGFTLCAAVSYCIPELPTAPNSVRAGACLAPAPLAICDL
jgi:hypothetical protein